MNKYLFFIIVVLIISGNSSYSSSKTNKKSTKELLLSKKAAIQNLHLKSENKKNLEDFLPKGYVIFETHYDDLNKDNKQDCIIIIKGTNKEKIIKHEYLGELDRNRRGIIVLLNKNDDYELVLKNYDCFSSENEEGGAYYAPELSFETKKEKLFINYSHGRYGYWQYTFRFQNFDFELIGYDASNNYGPIVNDKISINFLTKKKIIYKNTYKNGEGEEVFEKTVKQIKKSKLIKLSEIKDFSELVIQKK